MKSTWVYPMSCDVGASDQETRVLLPTSYLETTHSSSELCDVELDVYCHQENVTLLMRKGYLLFFLSPPFVAVIFKRSGGVEKLPTSMLELGFILFINKSVFFKVLCGQIYVLSTEYLFIMF